MHWFLCGVLLLLQAPDLSIWLFILSLSLSSPCYNMLLLRPTIWKLLRIEWEKTNKQRSKGNKAEGSEMWPKHLWTWNIHFYSLLLLNLPYFFNPSLWFLRKEKVWQTEAAQTSDSLRIPLENHMRRSTQSEMLLWMPLEEFWPFATNVADFNLDLELIYFFKQDPIFLHNNMLCKTLCMTQKKKSFFLWGLNKNSHCGFKSRESLGAFCGFFGWLPPKSCLPTLTNTAGVLVTCFQGEWMWVKAALQVLDNWYLMPPPLFCVGSSS